MLPPPCRSCAGDESCVTFFAIDQQQPMMMQPLMQPLRQQSFARLLIRSRAPQRGFAKRATGHGWYRRFMKMGQAGFVKTQPPTPFDFDAALRAGAAPRTRVFFELTTDGERLGRMEFELADDVVPMTARNFALLSEPGAAPSGRSYQGARIHRMVRGAAILGGDVDEAMAPTGWTGVKGDQGYAGGHSAWENQRYFEDEGFLIPHSEPGILTMANRGLGTNASQFYITTVPCPHLDGKCVAFGRVTSGLEIAQRIHDSLANKGRLLADIRIASCGSLS